MSNMPKDRLAISTAVLYWPKTQDGATPGQLRWNIFGKGGPQNQLVNPNKPWSKTRRIHNKHVSGTLTFSWQPD